jgi:hypothetical protein
MLKGATKLPCIAASSFMSSNYFNELLNYEYSIDIIITDIDFLQTSIYLNPIRISSTKFQRRKIKMREAFPFFKIREKLSENFQSKKN